MELRFSRGDRPLISESHSRLHFNREGCFEGSFMGVWSSEGNRDGIPEKEMVKQRAEGRVGVPQAELRERGFRKREEHVQRL